MREFDFPKSLESGVVGAEVMRGMAIVSARPHCFLGANAMPTSRIRSSPRISLKGIRGRIILGAHGPLACRDWRILLRSFIYTMRFPTTVRQIAVGRVHLFIQGHGRRSAFHINQIHLGSGGRRRILARRRQFPRPLGAYGLLWILKGRGGGHTKGACCPILVLR